MGNSYSEEERQRNQVRVLRAYQEQKRIRAVNLQLQLTRIQQEEEKRRNEEMRIQAKCREEERQKRDEKRRQQEKQKKEERRFREKEEERRIREKEEERRIREKEEERWIREKEEERRIREKEKEKAIEQSITVNKFPNPILVECKGNFLWVAISSNRITANWSNCDNAFVKIVPLHFHSEEARPIVHLFKLNNNFCYIDKIERVQNPFLLSAFLLKKRELENRFKCYIKEELLFHGTKSENVDSICRYNFDWRRSDQNGNRPYGKGVSFAVQASFASHYSDTRNTKKVMIVCRVLISKIYDGSNHDDIVPENYDTTLTNDGNVIVKFGDNEFYPAYIITYNKFNC